MLTNAFNTSVSHSRAWSRVLDHGVLSLGESANGAMREPELAVQRLVTAVIQRLGDTIPGPNQRVIMLIGHQKAMAILMLIGRYITHAIIVNCLQLEPPVPPSV